MDRAIGTFLFVCYLMCVNICVYAHTDTYTREKHIHQAECSKSHTIKASAFLLNYSPALPFFTLLKYFSLYHSTTFYLSLIFHCWLIVIFFPVSKIHCVIFKVVCFYIILVNFLEIVRIFLEIF